MASRIIAVIGMVLLFSGLYDSVQAATESSVRGPVRSSLDVANPNFQNWVQSSGSARFNFTNRGFFGNDGPSQSGAMNDPCPPGDWAPQMEFPIGSGQSYLYQATLWIGAEVVEVGSSHYRVSVGTDGWQSPSINEFFPGDSAEVIHRSNLPEATDCFGNSIYSPDARANYETVATYSDTLVDAFWVENDPVDGVHDPLGLEITQSILTWGSPEFSNLAIMEFKIRNIGDQFLKNLYLGLYADADCGPATQMEHHTDDITGFLRIDPETGDTLNIGWAADNDGRPPQASTGPLDNPHSMGVMALEGPTSSMRASYNWWISNADVSLDFGPSWISYAEEDSLGMGWSEDMGTPEGDQRRYQVLFNGEQDFDQIYADDEDWIASHPQHSYDPNCNRELNEPWSQTHPAGQAADLADGFDTRFMMSWGPVGTFDYVEPNGCNVYRLNPGEEFTFTFAYLLGPWFHDPENPQPSNTNIDPSLFDFAGLIESANAAKYLFEHNYEGIVTPPENFAPTGSLDGAVPLAWAAPSSGTIDHYELFGIDPHSPEDTVLLSTLMDPGALMQGLTNGDDWKWMVRTVDLSGFHSDFADTLVRVGAVLPVTDLHAEVDGAAVHLTWDASDDPALTSYTIARRSILGDSVTFSTTANSWTDDATVSGRYYDYWVMTECSRGITGLPTGPVGALPFEPQERILVVEERKAFTFLDSIQIGINPDSVHACYEALMSALGYEYELIVQDRAEPLSYTLETLGQYDIVLWHSEGNRYVAGSLMRDREDLFEEYIRLGGRMIRAGRNVLYKDFQLFSGVPINEEMLYPLTIDSVLAGYAPSAHNYGNFAFAGATSLDPRFPDVDLDPARVRQLRITNDTLEYLYDVELFWPRGTTWPLYSAEVAPEDTSGYGGEPCAAVMDRMVMLLFPLYFIDQEDSRQILQASIDGLRSGAFDVPKTPAVTIPNSIVLHQNYPNPFNPETTISFALPASAHAILKVYDIMGREVTTLLNERLTAGSHELNFDAGGLPSGIYFYRLKAGNDMITRKMVLLK